MWEASLATYFETYYYPLKLYAIDGEFAIEIKSSKASPAKIKKIYENWLVEKAKSVFKHKVDEYSKKVRVKVETITIKHLKIGVAVWQKKGQLT